MNASAVNLYDRSVGLLKLAEAVREQRGLIDGLADELIGAESIEGERAAVFHLVALSTAIYAEELAAELRRAARVAWVHTTEAEFTRMEEAIENAGGKQ